MTEPSPLLSPEKSAEKSSLPPLTSRYKSVGSPYRQPLVWKQLQLEEERRAQREKVKNAQKTKILMMQFNHFEYDTNGKLSIHTKRRKIVKKKRFIRELPQYLDRRLHVKTHVQADKTADPVLLNGLSYIDYGRWPNTAMRNECSPLIRPESPKPSPLKRTSLDMEQYLKESKRREIQWRKKRRKERRQAAGITDHSLMNFEDDDYDSEEESGDDNEGNYEDDDDENGEFEGLTEEEIRSILKIRHLLLQAVDLCDDNNPPYTGPYPNTDNNISLHHAAARLGVSSDQKEFPSRTQSATIRSPQQQYQPQPQLQQQQHLQSPEQDNHRPMVNISQWMQDKQRRSSPTSPVAAAGAHYPMPARPATAHPVSSTTFFPNSSNNSINNSNNQQYHQAGNMGAAVNTAGNTSYPFQHSSIPSNPASPTTDNVNSINYVGENPNLNNNKPAAFPERRLSPMEMRHWKETMTFQQAEAHLSPSADIQLHKLEKKEAQSAQRNLASAFDNAVDSSNTLALSNKPSHALLPNMSNLTDTSGFLDLQQQQVNGSAAVNDVALEFSSNQAKSVAAPSPPVSTQPSHRPDHHQQHQHHSELANIVDISTQQKYGQETTNGGTKKSNPLIAVALGSEAFLSVLHHKEKSTGPKQDSDFQQLGVTAETTVSSHDTAQSEEASPSKELTKKKSNHLIAAALGSGAFLSVLHGKQKSGKAAESADLSVEETTVKTVEEDKVGDDEDRKKKVNPFIAVALGSEAFLSVLHHAQKTGPKQTDAKVASDAVNEHESTATGQDQVRENAGNDDEIKKRPNPMIAAAMGGGGFLSVLQAKKSTLKKTVTSSSENTAKASEKSKINMIMSENEFNERQRKLNEFIRSMESWQVPCIEDLRNPVTANSTTSTDNNTAGGNQDIKLLGRGKFSAVYALSSAGSTANPSPRKTSSSITATAANSIFSQQQQRQGLVVQISLPTIFRCTRNIPTLLPSQNMNIADADTAEKSPTWQVSTAAAWKLAQYQPRQLVARTITSNAEPNSPNNGDGKAGANNTVVKMADVAPPVTVVHEYLREIDALTRMQRVIHDQLFASTAPNDTVFAQNAQLLQNLVQYRLAHHSPMVKLLGYTTHPSSFGVLLEYVSGPGDLFQFVQQLLLSTTSSTAATVSIDRENWLVLMLDLAHGLCLMHEQAHLIHRDIKPHNVLIRDTMPINTSSLSNTNKHEEEDNVQTKVQQLLRYRAVLTDLGTAVPLSYSPSHCKQHFAHNTSSSSGGSSSNNNSRSKTLELLVEVVGTHGYTAPEVMACEQQNTNNNDTADHSPNTSGYSYPADVYSLGQVFQFIVEAISKLSDHHHADNNSASHNAEDWVHYLKEHILPSMLHTNDLAYSWSTRPTARDIHRQLQALWQSAVMDKISSS